MLLGRSKDANKVNSLFGEGVNPLTRTIDEALTILGVARRRIAQSWQQARVYVGLARHYREVLLGVADRPAYLLPQAKGASAAGLDCTFLDHALAHEPTAEPRTARDRRRA